MEKMICRILADNEIIGLFKSRTEFPVLSDINTYYGFLFQSCFSNEIKVIKHYSEFWILPKTGASSWAWFLLGE